MPAPGWASAARPLRPGTGERSGRGTGRAGLGAAGRVGVPPPRLRSPRPAQSTVCEKIMELLGQNEVEQRQRKVLILSQDSFYKVLTAEQQAKALKGQYNFDHPGEPLTMPAPAGFSRCLERSWVLREALVGNGKCWRTEMCFPPPKHPFVLPLCPLLLTALLEPWRGAEHPSPLRAPLPTLERLRNKPHHSPNPFLLLLVHTNSCSPGPGGMLWIVGGTGSCPWLKSGACWVDDGNHERCLRFSNWLLTNRRTKLHKITQSLSGLIKLYNDQLHLWDLNFIALQLLKNSKLSLPYL